MSQKRKASALTQRATWNHAAISKWARETETFELGFLDLLKEKLPETLGFHVRGHENKRNRHDVIVEHRDFPNQKVLLELECGTGQSQWLESLFDNRDKWVFGLNILSRKISEGKHYDIFVKHNMAGKSFFAARYGWILEHGLVVHLKKHSLHFKTDSTVYSIPWAAVSNDKPYDFCFDDFASLQKMMLGILKTPTKKDPEKEAATLF